MSPPISTFSHGLKLNPLKSPCCLCYRQRESMSVGTFATFVVTDESCEEKSSQRVVVTPLAGDRVAPVWNYRRYVRLPFHYITSESKVRRWCPFIFLTYPITTFSCSSLGSFC